MPLHAEYALQTLHATLDYSGETIALALLAAEDFTAASNTIVDFAAWATFDDYLSEREGFAMGLSSAGQDAKLIAVSLRGFTAWGTLSNLPATAANLDVFAAQVEELRLDMDSARRGRQYLFAGGIMPHSQMTSKIMDRYSDWLACVISLPFTDSLPSIERYAELLLELFQDFE